MDCTSDIDDVPVFVRPTPTTRVLPDDYRLQTSTGSAHGNLRHRSSSANRLRLVPVCSSTQRCCSHGTVRTLCCRRRNSSTRSLLSIAEFDGQHSNVDAHSFEIQPTDLRYYSQGDDHAAAAAGKVHLISLRPDEILSQIRSSPPCCNPVPFQSYEANSAIGEVTLTGLHNEKSNAHISIVEIKFKSGQKIDLSGVKSLTVEILDLDCRTNTRRITGSVISHTSDKICTVLKDILLHMQIFYWEDSFIHIRVELLDHDEVDHFSSDTYSTAISPCSHATVIHPRPLIMSTLPDDDRILHNQPLSDTMVCVSGTEAAKFYLVHGHNSRDDENCRAMQQTTNMDTNEEMVEVSNTSDPEQNNFSINLDCKKLYSIINSRETIQYPCIFRTTWSFSNNTIVPIILRILPLKCGGRHISLWAEISSPVPQCLPLDQITVEATAYNPCKGRNCGQLGRSVRCTENLKFIETERCCRCQVSFDELMLQMHAFYCKQIQIDIKSF